MAKIVMGVNDFESCCSELLKEWDFAKNLVHPNNVGKASKLEVWWRCENAHSWKARIYQRTAGHGCPYCSGRIPVRGKNDFETWCLENNNQTLLDEWDKKKNSINPWEVTSGSGKKVWWRCLNCDNEWSTSIDNRKKGAKCPECSKKIRGQRKTKNHIQLKGSLASLNPELCKEWNWERNANTPHEINKGSRRKVWWICSTCKNEWEATIASRACNNAGCPKCGKINAPLIRLQNMLKVRGSLADSNNVLINEWDYEKNNPLRPENVTAGSDKEAWWLCSVCGNSWKSRIYNRLHGIGCPQCAKEMQSSFPEQAVFFYLKKYFNNAINGYKNLGKELDIFLPDIKVAVEYDGKIYHSDIDKDIKKNDLCIENSIFLYRIRENGAPLLPKKKGIKVFGVEPGDVNQLSNVIRIILGELGVECTDINIDRDQTDIYNQYISKKKEKSLSKTNPEIAKEWDLVKNKNVLPDMVSRGTNKKVWWRCSENHSYKASISSRVAGKTGCPYCANLKVLVGYNDLSTRFPNIAAEWDYEKNEDLLLENIVGGKQKVWWICSKGHSFYASVNNRISKKSGCPYCTNYKVLAGYNDIGVTHPEIALQWDYDKNKNLLPNMFMIGSRQRVWWKCPSGHSYDMPIVQRLKCNCPICSSKRVQKGENDLASSNPDLLGEWDYERNTVKPEQISTYSGKKVWWVCNRGHSYLATPSDKVTSKTGCPFCKNKKVLIGYNDLETREPDLCKDWDYEKNTVLPSQVVAGTQKKVWWKCRICSHEWEAQIVSRVKGRGCPKCGQLRSRSTKEKAVINLDTGEIFSSIGEAARKLNISPSHFAAHIRGERKTFGGYHWKYYK